MEIVGTGYSSMACSISSLCARPTNSSSVTLPWSPWPRVRTLTLLVVDFLVAEDEDERDLLQAEVADLGIHLLVACVEFDAQAGGFEARFDLSA